MPKQILDVLDEIKERCKKATEGPWSVVDCGDEGSASVVSDAGNTIIHSDYRRSTQYGLEIGSDADLIAHSRTDLPKLERALRVAVEGLSRIERGDGACTRSFVRIARRTLSDTSRILTGEE